MKTMGKIIVIFCIMLFAFAMTNVSIAENLEKTDEKIVFEVTSADSPVSNTGMYSDPVVVITEPEDGDSIHIPYLEVAGYATDPDGLDYVHWKWEWAHGSYTNDSILDAGTMYTFSFRIYNLPEGWHKVTVTFCDTTDDCGSDNVTVTYIENEPPTKPGRPYGPDRGAVDMEYTFSTHSTDLENDTIRYGWDWDGDSAVDEWTGFYSSGSTCSVSHSWPSAGTYYIKVKAKDVYGAQSGFSLALTFVISSENHPPEKPVRPSGSTHGKVGVSYSYESLTTDPDGDHIYYMFDWDDGTTSGWKGPYKSGDIVSVSHIWSARGSYAVKVKAKDIHDLEGTWSDPLPITMPKNKPYINTPFLQFLDNHPHLFPLLRQLLRL